MTDEMMALRALVATIPDADLLHEMIGFAAERLMERELGALTGAGWGEKSRARLVQRNGYRDRAWQTRAGVVELVERAALNPQAQEGRLLPVLPRTTAHGREGADGGAPGSLRRGIDRGCGRDRSTRSVDDLVKAMGMTGISRRQVSRLCEEIDGRVKVFLERPLEGDWPYLWIA